MTGVPETVQTKRGRHAAYAVVAGVGILYAVLALLRLTRFDLTAFDAGVFDNVLWRLGNGYNDVSDLTGSHHLSDHMSLLMLMTVPIYAVAPQLALPILIVAQAASVALVALAAWLLASHLGLDDQNRRAVLLVTTIGAGAYNAALIDVHEVGLALGPLALTAVLAIRGAPLRSYWIWPALAALARIDLAVSVLIIGLLLRRDHPEHGRVAIWIGAGATSLMGVWLLANPWDGTSFAFHFAHLGIDSAAQLPGAILRDPRAALEPLLDPKVYGTILIWLIGFMTLPPLRAARWILPAVPTVIIPALGSWPQADRPHLHYWHVLLPMLAIAMVFGLARSTKLQTVAIYLAAAGVAVTWIFMPTFKPSFGDDLTGERAIVTYLQDQPDASVAALDILVPHLSQRASVMQLPTPFACPTQPIASFKGPQQPPDLVAIPAAVVRNPGTPAAETVATVLNTYYERTAVFDDLEVWSVSASVPEEFYDVACGAAASENSR